MGIILASQSPRRKELLELAGIEHRVIVSQVDEILDEDLDVAGQVQDLAIQKACAVAELFPQETIIGADTIVVFGGKILGKPKNEEDAFNMLKSLSGRNHHPPGQDHRRPGGRGSGSEQVRLPGPAHRGSGKAAGGHRHRR